jgi:hypothetical protein
VVFTIFARYKNVTRLYLVGDSKIIIDWFSNDGNFQLISLQYWMGKIRILSESFQHLKDQHIYREYNQDVDQLSKDALQLKEDGIYFAKVTKGQSNTFERLAVNQ